MPVSYTHLDVYKRQAQGYITMAGRIPKAFWAKKIYGYEIAGN